MDKLLERCPELSASELSERISAEVGHEEFLFYRVSQGDDLDWILDAGKDGYEMFCTACGQHFFEPRDRKHTAKHYTHCPQCGAEISPKRWRDRARLESIEFAYHVFQHGEGADVWLRSFQVSMDRNFMGRKYDIFEYCRALFQPGGAHKWTRSRSWYNGVSKWKTVKSICLKRWHGNYGQTRDDIWAGVTMEEMEGSCLQYVPMGEVKPLLDDIVSFLALWCKYPAVEYVWKMGFGEWFAQRERYGGVAFSRVVNLRAKRPDKLFPHLSKGEIKLLRRRTGSISINAVEQYQRLKKAGAVEPGAAGMEFAREVNMSRYIDFFALAERCGATPRELRKYLQKQAGRSAGACVHIVMQELDDYLGQLNRLGVQGGDRMPRDLHEAHERLSARERKLKNAPLNGKFRARRHLLRWMCWKHDGMFIRPVDSAEEITREGEQQSNCVAGYDTSKFPDGWKPEATTIGVRGDPTQALTGVAGSMPIPTDATALTQSLLDTVKNVAGANDAALGNIKNPDNTSAIVAVQQATAAPLSLTRLAYYQMIEDYTRVIIDMMHAYYGIREVKVTVKEADPVTGEMKERTDIKMFDYSTMPVDALDLNINVGAASYWAETLQTSTLDNLMNANIIPDAIEYLKRVPDGMIRDKTGLMEAVERVQKQREAAAVLQGGVM